MNYVTKSNNVINYYASQVPKSYKLLEEFVNLPCQTLTESQRGRTQTYLIKSLTESQRGRTHL